jgi:hypothetical protein
VKRGTFLTRYFLEMKMSLMGGHPVQVLGGHPVQVLGGHPVQVLGEQGKFFTVLALSGGGPLRGEAVVSVSGGSSLAVLSEESEEDILVCGRCKAHFSQAESMY